jgi:hypothetical protein
MRWDSSFEPNQKQLTTCKPYFWVGLHGAWRKNAAGCEEELRTAAVVLAIAAMRAAAGGNPTNVDDRQRWSLLFHNWTD